MPPLLTKIDFGLISLADQANEIIIYNLVNMDQVFRLRGKSSLSLKFLYSSNFEFCVFFFYTDKFTNCSITLSFHYLVPLNFYEIKIDSTKFYYSAMIEFISYSHRK